MWNAPELTPTTANDEINTSLAYGFGFDFCGVEIDASTGIVNVDKYVSAHDCGTVLNPGLAEGQIRGSWASAYGATFLEEFCYDADGAFRSGTFAEYLVPTAADLPDLTLVHPTPHPSPYTRLGAKGIAEGNQYSTPVCIANAVADALGIDDVQLPLKPAKVLEWLAPEEPPPSSNAVLGSAARLEPATLGQPTISGSDEMQMPATPAQIWDMLLDPNRLARIVPGCEKLEASGDKGFTGTVILGVGPVKGRFDARIDLIDLEKPNKATLVGSAHGALGASRGTGAFELIGNDGGTLVRYSYSVELSGKVVAVGGRMIRGAAKQLIDRFMHALVQQAGRDDGPRDPSGGLAGRLKRLVRSDR